MADLKETIIDGNLSVTDKVSSSIVEANQYLKIPNNGIDGRGLVNALGVSIIRDHNNQNVSVSATGGQLLLGYSNTTKINFLNGKSYINNDGNFSGNAASATKLAEAKTITLNGDVTGSYSFDGSENKSFATHRRGCAVGQHTNENLDKPWFKFAEATMDSANSDINITFHVYDSYQNRTQRGILSAHVRTNSSGYWTNSDFYWERASYTIDTNNFVLLHNTETNPTKVELWVKITTAWTHYLFDVVSEGYRDSRAHSAWTLYDTSTSGGQESLPSEMAQQTSTLLEIQNPIALVRGSAAATLNFTTTNEAYTGYIKAYSKETYGQNVVFKFGGNVILGGGEFADNAYNNNVDECSDNGENLYLGADSNIFFYSNANTIGSRRTMKFDMSGQLNLPNNIYFADGNNSGIIWKEYGYGDKFRLLPNFSGADDENKFRIQGTVGTAGTDPTSWVDLLTVSGKSGNVVIKGTATATNFSGKWNNRNLTVGTNAPSGGSAGDIYIQYFT